MTIAEIHRLFLQCTSISTDTRKIENNCMFVALKGENFDANTFAEEALAKGAKYVIVDNPKYATSDKTILVENSLTALQQLATYHREFLKIPIVALTGSNGKTTTKELIQVVLAKKFKTKATKGNLNNHIGVPLTLLSFSKETEIGIVEMGANHQKEIEFLCEIAKPDYGYITNFGKAHLEGFGGIEGVIKGKSEMYTYLKANSKTVFVNLDDAIQNDKTIDFNRITFSQKDTSANVFINEISANPFVKIKTLTTEINSHLIGLYNTNNINVAITIGNYFGVSTSDIKVAIESYIPENNRSQLINKDSYEIILDAYNANPSSMKVALENFIQLDKTNKIAILGDMYELGEESLAEHKYIVDFLTKNSSFECYFIGKYFFENKSENSNFHFYESFEMFSNSLRNTNWKDKTILIKGSRGMALERTLEYI
ncbi:UDP-N-acetylmuramoyl-tripeptide--D-alanyl-D-alanine ligase [Flavobacterium macrobrachii]|uniref:UDP-N-acetylmuramoyl-tripeptide--D-alanyl-D-alanine ligase n=1 Tax=Flavobacterium macrobrachii TaxID=591204 RepID=A0ABS2CWL4_9FLAO|nr:UDP-N-acetylmuramoyl-tripeptide--D-alanyl-D-alanine ligase [Flavobacterium macrobrachii]MBM6499286.1 UDP-N-acetylmuramoyl-tripeptide--D-alanyl-D-alanine ligase [Flavobacterium macrobrachii]